MLNKDKEVYNIMEIPNTDISSFLKMIDSFYNNAWNRLTIILIIGGSIIVVVLPIIFKLISDYRTKIRVDKVENNLKEQFQNLSDENVKLIEKEMDKISEAIDKVISKKLEDVDIKVNVSSGLIWHVLGNSELEKNQLELALKHFFYAFDCYFDGKNELNMQIIINNIETVYKEVKDLSLLKELENRHLDLIKKLYDINENSRYSNTIDKIEEEFNNLKKRLKEDKN